MPKIGLSLRQGNKGGSPRIGAPPPLTLYEDNLRAWGSAGAPFVNRQWFSSADAGSVFYSEFSGATGVAIGNFDQNASGLAISGGATRSGRHCLVHFDCLKEKYPTYTDNRTYNSGAILTATGVDLGSFSDGTFPIIQGNGSGGVITVLNGVISVTSAGTGYVDGEAIKAGGSRYNLVTGEVVYGGIVGHALYRKTRSDQSQNATPIFLNPTGAQDVNGWSRYRPAMRTIQEGNSINVRFKLEVINPLSTFYSTSNVLRIGLFGDNGGSFISSDNIGTTGNVFLPYTGYMIGLGLNHRILKRIPNSNISLILSAAAFTQLASTPISFNPTQNPFLPTRDLRPILQVDLTIGKSEGSAYIRSIITGHNGNGDVTEGIELQTTDTADALNFNTLVVASVSNAMDAFKISDVKIIYNR